MQPPQQSGGSDEIARLKVGVPGVSAEVPIRGSFLRPLVRLFRQLPSEQLVRVVGARSIVHIPEDDAGSADVYLKVVNMTDRAVRVDNLHLELFYTGGVATAVAQPLFKAPAKPIPPHDVDEVYLTIQLAAAAIRETLRRIQKAQNPFSSPGIELTVGGNLDLHIPGSVAALQRARTIRLPFTVAIRQPELNINCPSVRS